MGERTAGRSAFYDVLTCIELGLKVRHALEPQNPDVIRQYLCAVPRSVLRGESEETEYLTAQFALLLETVADDALPMHWRRSCLDQAYRPLLGLRALPRSWRRESEVRMLVQQLRSAGRTFQSSMASEC